ncbi:MAG: hypothetical protein KGO51_14750 [Alphaproteobacteria bacterium]|nr:hypothetical protein [Alphaproteobacteria bacterium]
MESLAVSASPAVRRRQYRSALAVTGPLEIGELAPPILRVAVEQRSKMTDAAIRFAMSLTRDVIAVHLNRLEGPEAEDDGAALKAQWREAVAAPAEARGATAPRLVLLPAPYREMHAPLLKFVDKLSAEAPGRPIGVLIPELVEGGWRTRLLHTGRAARLRALLMKHAGPNVNLIISPWKPDPGSTRAGPSRAGPAAPPS